MKVNQLDARIQELARRALDSGKPLTREDVDTLAREARVEPGQIRAGFLEALGTLQRGVAANESGGDRSADLRSMLAGQGRFEGEKTASAATSPALRGTNLKVPTDATKPFVLLAASYTALAEQASRGLLSTDEVSRALAELPVPDRAAVDALWSPGGAPARESLSASMKQLAAAAPNARMWNDPPRTVAASSLQWELNAALFARDMEGAKAIASAFVQAFPADPLADFARNVARGEMTPPGNAGAPNVQD